MEILNTIKNRCNISETFENAKAMDSENRIFKSDNYVIKIYFPKKYVYYYNELEVYKNLDGSPFIAKLLYYGEEPNFKYIVISRLLGKSLFDSWQELDDDTRKSSIEQIANILKNINSIRMYTIDFKSFLDKKYQKAFSHLTYNPMFLKYLEDIYERLSVKVSDKEEGHLIHLDTHFYNFFIDAGRIYAYDFENTLMAPLDYQLVRWYRMWKYPNTFIYPAGILSLEEEKKYDLLMPTMQMTYPELFKGEGFEKRIKLYMFIYLLEEAKRCNLSSEIVQNYIDENRLIRIRR